MRHIDPHLFADIYREYNSAATKAQKSAVIKRFRDLTGLGRSAAFRRLAAANNTSPTQAARGARGKKKLSKTEKAELFEIARVKMAGAVDRSGRIIPGRYALSTERAIELCETHGWIASGRWTRSTADSWLRRHELSVRSFNRDRANAVEFHADYPLQLVFADASPLNRIFVRLDSNRLVARPSMFEKDSHFEDNLRRDGLSKIWVYFYVDLYSRAYWLRAFAPPGGGENSADWLEFLTECFLPSTKTVIEGIPEITYADKGNGIKSNAVRNFLRRLGVVPQYHKVGNPRAKGGVEGRIGGFKRSFETLLNLVDDQEISSLDTLNRFLQGWAIDDNQRRGRFEKFQQGALIKPIRRCNLQNIHDATTMMVRRSIDSKGCVTIDKERHYVSRELFRGDKVEIYRNLTGAMIAQEPKSGRCWPLDEYGPRKVIPGQFQVMDGKADSWKESQSELDQIEIMQKARSVRKMLSFEDVMPKPENVRHLPAAGNPTETHSPIAPESFETADDARLFIYYQTGVRFNDLPEAFRVAVNKLMEGAAETYGFIERDTVYKICEEIIQEQKKTGAKES